MINLYSRQCPESKFIGSYLKDPEDHSDAIELIRDIDALTFEKRKDTLFDYVNEIARCILEYGFYGDEIIFVEHLKEDLDGSGNS